MMKCPYCNIDMLHGYLQCGIVIWSTKKHKISLLPNKKKEQYALYLKQPLAAGANYVESDCCPKCKRIIIDSADYENNIGGENGSGI